MALSGLLLTLILTACSRIGGERFPMVGKDPVKAVLVSDNHSESLIDWAQKGYQGITVIHVDAHDDLAFIPEEKIGELRTLIAAKDWDGLRQRMDAGHGSLFMLTNYLYAAAHLGIVKEVYWVIPYTYFEVAGGGAQARNFLKRAGSVKDSAEIDAMTFSGGCLHGMVKGVSLHVCGADTVPLIKEPVILDIGVDFFPVFASERRLSRLRGFKIFFDFLVGRGYRVASANIAYSASGGYLTPSHRYIGSQMAEALKKPEIMQAEEAPELWKVRDHIDNLLTAGESGLAREAVEEAIQRFPEDRPLLAMAAAAEYGAGNTAEALRLGTGLCSQDRAYCAVLIYLGDLAMEKKMFRDAEVFFKAGISGDPEWPFGNEKFGNALLDMGRSEEALRFLEKAAAKEDDINLRFRMGDAAFLAGDAAAALRFYDMARQMYDSRVGLSNREQNMVSVDRMVSLYKKVGRSDDAAAALLMFKGGKE